MNKEEIAKSIDEGLKILKQEPSFVFNLEEIKAIEKIDYIQDFIVETGQYNADVGDMECFSTLLNLISKLQKEVKEYEEDIENEKKCLEDIK